jgi:hypothetical protein
MTKESNESYTGKAGHHALMPGASAQVVITCAVENPTDDTVLVVFSLGNCRNNTVTDMIRFPKFVE